MVSRFIPDSIKYGGLVAKAASDDEVPPAGYLQEELKKLTFDPDGCTGVEDALLARLEKRSANVKLKTLRLIKMLCESGAPTFRRDMQRRVKEVRECLHWQGPAHPTMGDLPNKMVREAAQQVRCLPAPCSRSRCGAAALGARCGFPCSAAARGDHRLCASADNAADAADAAADPAAAAAGDQHRA